MNIKHTTNKIFRIFGSTILGLFSFFIWLLLPPIFIFITKPIKKLWIRFLLCLISPITIWICAVSLDYLERRHRYDNHEAISEILNFDFPSYEVVDYKEEVIKSHIRRGYDITKTIRFNQPVTPRFYEIIDSLSFEVDTAWETEQYSLVFSNFVKEYVDKWGEDSLYLYISEWDSIAKIEARKVKNDTYYYYGHYIQLQIKKDSVSIIKYCD